MNKMFSRVGLVAGSALATAGAANAAVPAEITTAITAMGTDGALIAGAVLVALIAVIAIKFLRKAF